MNVSPGVGSVVVNTPTAVPTSAVCDSRSCDRASADGPSGEPISSISNPFTPNNCTCTPSAEDSGVKRSTTAWPAVAANGNETVDGRVAGSWPPVP